MSTHAILVVALAGSAALAQTSANSDFSAIRREIEQNVAAGKVPAVSVAVAKQGKVVWEEGFGWADREKRIRATTDTLYSIASVTKTITATAIMILESRGKIRLDIPVNEYLGAAKVHSPRWNAADATVWRVATHTAGLTTFSHVCVAGDGRCQVSLDKEIGRYGILFWPPGEVFDYSNLGYGILGEVVERASGVRFGDFLQKEVLAPLGMNHCALEVPPSLSRLAAPQYNEKTQKRSKEKISGHPGASALHCSAHDLALLGMFLLKDHLPTQRTILSDSDVDEMERPQPGTRGQYGLGLWLKEQAGQTIISAQGGTTDSYALLEAIPSADAVVVVLSNSFAAFTSELSDKIRGVLVPKLSPPTRQSAPAQTARSEANPPDLVGEWTGNVISYRGSIPLSLTIKSSGPVLGRVGGGPISELGQPSLKGQHLYGQLPGDPHLIDAPRTAYVLEIDAFLRGDTLVGAATSRLLQGEGDQLPHWVELTRAH